MSNILRVAIGLAGAVFMALALGFLYDPVRAAAQLGIGPLGALGPATLRGDFFAFFTVGGLFSLVGAIRNDGRWLLAPLLLLALALVGRLVTLVTAGFDPVMVPPMVAEAVMATLLFLGRRAFARP